MPDRRPTPCSHPAFVARRPTRWATVVFALLCSLLGAVPLSAQGTKPDAAAPGQGPTVEVLQARMTALAADERLEPAVREQASTLFGRAVKQLEAARASEAAAQEFQTLTGTAPKQAAEQRRMLEPGGELGIAALGADGATVTRTDLEQALAAAQANAAALRSRGTELSEKLIALEARPTAANAELVAARQQLQALDAAAPDPGTDPAVVVEARAAQRAAQRRALAARVHLLEQELAARPAQQDLLQAQGAVVTRQRTVVDAQVTELQARRQRLLERDAETERRDAQRATDALAAGHPLLVAQAAANEKQSDVLTGLVQQLSGIAAVRAQAEAMRTQLADSQTAAREAMSIGSGGKDFSAILRKIRGEVPPVLALAREIATRKRVILDGRLARLELRGELRLPGDPQAVAKRLDVSLPEGEPPLPVDAAVILEGLLAKRRDLIQQTIQAHDNLITRLQELVLLQQEVQTGSAELTRALHERLLWLPSAPPLGSSRGRDLWAGVQWIADLGSWEKVLTVGRDRGLTLLPITAVVALVVLGLSLVRRRLRLQLKAIAERVGPVGSDAHHLTPQAVGISMLLVAPGWIVPIYLGILLLHSSVEASFVRGVGEALVGVGVLVAILRTFGQMCRADGVFGAHFGWSDRSRRVLGSNLRWLIAVLVPAALVVVMTDASGSETYRNGLGRMAFMTASAGLSLFSFRVLHPRHGAFAEMLPRAGVLWSSRSLWFPLVFLAPATLGGLAGYGYFDTAALIQQRLFSTGWISLLALVGYSVVMRWVVVAHRRMALQRAQKARDLARAARAQKSATEAAGEAMPELEVPNIDLSSVNQQTRTLIRAAVGVSMAFALWMVWSQMFPALGVLDDVPAWQQSVVTETGTESVSVSWAAVLGALLIVAATMLAYRNLPGLVEITLFRRGTIDRGARYAIVTISRYLIAMVGVVFAFNHVGWDWSRAQWIVAAMGVGLGFGLQEIVANFVSGLIILFERPVRVGDTVTVGELSGTVSRLQIRATTITDWDNREIIVPNKDLITGRVVNWTLSTSVTRLVLNVGVAYGTDTVRAQQILLQAAKAVDNVLTAPAPTVFFLGFGDSSLNFEVRVFVGELAHRLPVMHELHTAVNQALGKHGIEIPFPQRDVHMRMAKGSVELAPPADDEIDAVGREQRTDR